MIKVWGRRNSGNVIKVLWCLDEIGEPFTLEEIGGSFGRNREDWYLAMNPNGLVPTIDDNGYTIWESNAILRYLAATYSTGSLWPTGVKARADIDRWMDWPQRVQPFMTILNVALTRTPVEQRDVSAIATATQKAAEVWAVLDRHLANHAFVGGDDFTIGDIAIGNFGYRWFNLNLDRPTLTHIERWYERLTGRPAFYSQVMRPLG